MINIVGVGERLTVKSDCADWQSNKIVKSKQWFLFYNKYRAVMFLQSKPEHMSV